MAVGFCFGISLGIRDVTMRTVARVLSFVPALVAYLALKPPSFGSSVTIQLSTSQWIAFGSALTVSYFYAQYWTAARRSPALAMNLASLGPGAVGAPNEGEDAEPAKASEEAASADETDDNDDSTVAEAPAPKRKKKKKARAKEAEEKAPDAAAEPEKATPEEAKP
jgi:phosphatidylglycerol---prolipoprotein diacylglyceryl transferase